MTLRPPRSELRDLRAWQAMLPGTADREPNPTALEELIERHTGMYADPVVREWLTKRLIVWASKQF